MENGRVKLEDGGGKEEQREGVELREGGGKIGGG